MKIKIILVGLFILFSTNIKGQTDTSVDVLPTPDSSIINYDNQNESSEFEEILEYKTQIQSQKVMKNLFFAGFLFMTFMVVAVFYVYKNKIKEFFEALQKQQREIDIRQFEVEKLSWIVNNTVDAITIIDNKNEILWYNNSFLFLYNYSEEEMKIKKIDFFDFKDTEIQELIAKCKKEIKPIEFTFEHKNKNAHTTYIQRRVIPLTNKDAEIINYAIIDTDYTALKLATKK